MKQDIVLVLDLGSEENTRIARAIRGLGVYSEIHPHDLSAAEIGGMGNVKGIILNGGRNNIVDGAAIDISPEVAGMGLPVLAVCHTGVRPRDMERFSDDDAALASELESFVFGVCGAERNWNMRNFIHDQVELVRREVGDGRVLLALSGGVDSSVVAALLHRAVGPQLHCIFVDNGLLRFGEHVAGRNQAAHDHGHQRKGAEQRHQPGTCGAVSHDGWDEGHDYKPAATAALSHTAVQRVTASDCGGCRPRNRSDQ